MALAVERPGVPRAFLALVGGQALHSVEEWAGRLWEVLPPARWVSGLVVPDLELGFVLFNAAWVAFGLGCWWWPIRRGWRGADALAWIWVAIEVVNGIGHPLLSLRAGTWMPGTATAPLLLALALYLGWRLTRDTPAGERAQGSVSGW